MLETQSPSIVEALLEALETMAFVALLPAEEPIQPPTDARLVTIEFSRPQPGVIELVAPAALGRLLTANLLGSSPDDPQVGTGEDALRELLNVTCGTLLHRCAVPGAQPFQMGIPQVRPFCIETQWDAFIHQDSVHVLDAEGNTLAVRLWPLIT